jgi:GT2 family glycosyltransferase
MDISIIIPVYNGGEKFKQCLASVAALDPHPYEVIIVADSDTDGSRSVAQQFITEKFPNHGQVIVQSPQAGPAAARNRGAEAAAGEILFFLDADCTVHPDALAKIAGLMQDNPVDALIGSYDDEPSEPNFLSQYKNLMHHYTHQTANDEAFTFWGACGAIRREVFLKIGGFDAVKYARPSIEDIELGYRLEAVGGRIRMVKDLQIKHLKKWTPQNLFRTDFYDRALPWTELILTSKGFTNDLNIGGKERINVALTGIMLAALVGGLIFRWLWLIAALAAVALIVLNIETYKFLARKRGPGFALMAIPWHWFYFLYSGVAYGIGLVRVKLMSA